MKVLVISASFPPMRSGGADYALRLCQHLAQAGLQVDVLTSRIRDVASDPGIRVHPIMQRWSWSEWPRLARLARRCRPDVINLHFVGSIYHHQPMVTFAPLLLKKLLPGVRVVTHMEHRWGIQSTAGSRAARLAWRLRPAWRALALGALVPQSGYEFGTILRDSDRIIVLSDLHRAGLEHHLPGVSRKCVLIPPPPIMRMRQADSQASLQAGQGQARRCGREMLGVPEADFLFAYYGYIDPWKGIETLLQAFAALCRARPGPPALKLALVGGSNEVMLKACDRPNYVRELHAMAEELGVEASLIWTGYYPTESDAASLYLRGADACVLPFSAGVYLNNSSFSAAAAHGLPIVTTRAQVVEPAFRDGENLLFATPGDSASLQQAMASLLDDALLRQHLSQGALQLAQEWFSWSRAVERTIEAFE